MQSAITVRDWTYVAVVALLMLSYGFSLLSQGFAARAASDTAVHVCVYSGESSMKAN
jgi:hypothetical protein